MDVQKYMKTLEETERTQPDVKEKIFALIEEGKNRGFSMEKIYQMMVRCGYCGSIQTLRRVYKEKTSKNKEN